MDADELRSKLEAHRAAVAGMAQQAAIVDERFVAVEEVIARLPDSEEKAELELHLAVARGSQITVKAVNGVLERQALLEEGMLSFAERMDAIERAVGIGPGSN